jgi:hypothetical protein
MGEHNEHSDYLWHFKLSDDVADGRTPDALTEMVRQQVRALLRCVILTSDSRDVAVTGFRFLDEPEREHALYSPAVLQGEPEVETSLSPNEDLDLQE